MQPLASNNSCIMQSNVSLQNTAYQLASNASACRSRRSTAIHSSSCTKYVTAAAAAPGSTRGGSLSISQPLRTRSACSRNSSSASRTPCSASSNKQHTSAVTNPATERLPANGHADLHVHHLKPRRSAAKPTQLLQRQPQQPATAVATLHAQQQVVAEQQRLIAALIDVTHRLSHSSSSQPQEQQQQSLAVWVTPWCCCMQPYLHDLPLSGLATVAICLGQQQQQQSSVGHTVTDPEFLHAYCAAAEAAAAAAAAGAAAGAGVLDKHLVFQQQWESVQQQQQQRIVVEQALLQQQQQQVEQLTMIIDWATDQLIQHQHQHWQQQQRFHHHHHHQQQQQQHAHQLQLHLRIRGSILQLLQAATSSRLLPAATSAVLQVLAGSYGRLGVPVDEAWMGRWLAAARHVITDLTVTCESGSTAPNNGSAAKQQQQQQQAAVVYSELTGLLHGLAVAKVKPPDSWLLTWQAAAAAMMQAAPDFSSSSGSSQASAAAEAEQPGTFLHSVHQLLHAVSFLGLKMSNEFWQGQEGLVQHQLLGFNSKELLVLLQIHQQSRLKPSAVCIKYMTAQLSRHIHQCWQQQQQQWQQLLPDSDPSSSSSSSGVLISMCMCVCGLAAWGVRLNMTSMCELLLCLAAASTLLPLPLLIQVLFTLGPRLALIGSSSSSSMVDSSSLIISSSGSSDGEDTAAADGRAAAAAAAAAVHDLLEYAAAQLASQQQPAAAAAVGSSPPHIRQLLQLLQLAAHLPRSSLRDSPLLSLLRDMVAAAAPVCSIADLVQIMKHWTKLGFSSAWRSGGMRRGYRRLSQPNALQGLSNADLAAAVAAAAKLPPLQRVVWRLAGEVSARLAHAAAAATPQQQQQQQGFTPKQMVDLLSAIPQLSAYWPPDQVLLLLLRIEGLEQQQLLNPADQWRVWSALQQLQQHWRPAVAAAAAADGVAAAAAGSSVVAAAPLHVDVQHDHAERTTAEPTSAAASDEESGSSSSTLDHQYHMQRRQQQQQLVAMLGKLQQQVAAALSTAAPVVLPLEASPVAGLHLNFQQTVTPIVTNVVTNGVTTTVQIPASWIHQQQSQQHADLTLQQLLQHLAKAHKALQSPKCTPEGLTRVCEGLCRMLAVPRFSSALDKAAAARSGVLRALEACAWPDLEAKTLDGHQLLLLLRACYNLGSREDSPYMQKLSQACVELLVTVPGTELATTLGKTAAAHLSGFCRSWEITLLRVWVGRVQDLAIQDPEAAVSVITPLVELGFKPAPGAAALVLLPLLRSTAAAAAGSSRGDLGSSEPSYSRYEQEQDDSIAAAAAATQDFMQQQQQGPTASVGDVSSAFAAAVADNTQQQQQQQQASTAVLGQEMPYTTAAAAEGWQQQQQGLSAKGVLLLTKALADLTLKPDPPAANLLLNCQIPIITRYNVSQLLQLGHHNMQLGLLGGPIGGLGVWRDLGVLPEAVAVWVKTWLETVKTRGPQQMTTSQVVELQLLLAEIDLMPLHTSTWSHRLFELQQQLQASLAAATGSSGSSRLSGWQQSLAAAVQASYQANRSAREAAAAAVRRTAVKQRRAAAAAAGGGYVTDLDSDDEYSSSSSAAEYTAAAGSSSSIRRIRSGIAATAGGSTGSSSSSAGPGFYYPADPDLLLLYQLQQQRCALMWTAVKFRVYRFEMGWMTSCLFVFQRRLAGLPPLVTIGLLTAAAEAGKAAAAASSSSSGAAPVESEHMDLIRRRAFGNLGQATADRVLGLVPRLKGELLVQAVSGLAAFAAAAAASGPQQQHRGEDSQPVVLQLNHKQQKSLLTVVLRQLPFIPPAQLPVLMRSLTSLPVRPASLASHQAGPDSLVMQPGVLAGQPETIRPNARWLAAACQVLATKAASADVAADPGQQLLLLAAARQLMALQPDAPAGAAAAVNQTSVTAAAGVAAVVGPGVTADIEVSPEVPSVSPQVPAAQPAGVGPLVTRALGTAGLQVLASLVQQLLGAKFQQQQQQQQQQRVATAAAVSPAPVTATLSGIAAQMLAFSETLRRQRQQQHSQLRLQLREESSSSSSAAAAAAMAAAAAGSDAAKGALQQQQRLAALSMVLGLRHQEHFSSSGGASLLPQQQQQQQPELSGPGQQQVLGMLLRMELQQALSTPLPAAAAVGSTAAAAAAAATTRSDPAATAAADGSNVSRKVAARGLQVKFDGLLRWAFRAAAAAMTAGGQQQQPVVLPTVAATLVQRNSSSSDDQEDIQTDVADISSSSGSDAEAAAGSSDSSVVVLPVMSRALDVQFARLLRQVLHLNMATQGTSK